MSRNARNAEAIAAWAAIVAPHFDYLIHDYQMTIISKETSNWETAVTYAKDPIAVIVRQSVEFGRAEVELVRMVDGQIPNVPIFVHDDTPVDRALLDHAIDMRAAPQEVAEMKGLAGLSECDLQRAVAFLGPVLRRIAGDFLRGDTSLMDEIGQLIRKRVSENPQQITLHMPEGTSPQEVDQAVARAQRVDPGVPVQVRFYRKRREQR